MYGAKKREAMGSKVENLMEAKFVKEVAYPKRLVNPILGKKSYDKYQICIDFTDLNQAYPKNCYPLPDINKLVDATARFEYFFSLDAMLGYH